MIFDKDNANGDSVLFFVHGNSSGPDIFKSAEGFINDRFEKTFYTLPGHGERNNEMFNEELFWSNLKSDLTKAVNNETKPVILIGHSFGGHLILNCLAKLKNVQGVLLIGTPPLKFPINVNEAFEPLEHSEYYFQADFEDEKLGLLIGSVVNEVEQMELLIRLFKSSNPRFRDELRSSLASGLLIDEINALNQFEGKKKLVFGEQDKFLNHNYISWLAGENSTEIIPNSGHFLSMETPEEIASIITEFAS